jgi:predicted methyltransferase
MTKRKVIASAIGFVALALAIALHGQDNASDAAKLIEVLQLKPGSTVAEIGAGGGELTIALAKHVGSEGRVFTSELGSDRLKRLRETVDKADMSHIQVVEGHEAHANLAEGCCDALFMRNVYHHFGDPASMNASIARALKPGGRVAIIDFAPPKATAAPGKRGEDGSHGVSAETVASELKDAGFEIVTTEERPKRWFLVVGVKAIR